MKKSLQPKNKEKKPFSRLKSLNVYFPYGPAFSAEGVGR
jgi:hypothetical protein